MACTTLLKPTFHVEVLLKKRDSSDTCKDVTNALIDRYAELWVGREINVSELDLKYTNNIESIVISDYTGAGGWLAHRDLQNIQLDVQSYTLKHECPPSARRAIHQDSDDDDAVPKARKVALPSVALRDEWDSLIYDDHLPAQLLRYLTRMLGLMKQPGLNLSTFNWNRLCLLHGPPGSGKSTLCRALAQKLSIRLSQVFPTAVLFEINTNAMLSKFFGESGKQIASLFEDVHAMAHSPSTLVCVVMDEIETIAGSRERATAGGECSDGLRATNQLLTALDRLRALPNVIVLCTSNFLDAIDTAFLDRVDIKQLIPCPSSDAIYAIFRSCLNELVRANLVDTTAMSVSARPAAVTGSSPSGPPTAKRRAVTRPGRKLSEAASSSPEERQFVSEPSIPTLAEMRTFHEGNAGSPGRRVWDLAQKCEGLSGRTLRRMPILGLAMYTWGGNCSLDDAVSALEAAVEQELLAKQTKEA